MTTKSESKKPHTNKRAPAWLGIAAILLCGCMGRKTKPVAAPSNHVSQFQSPPLPVPPPLPDAAPTAQDVAGASQDVTAAHESVSQVLKLAESIPQAAPAITPLTNADTHLTAATQKLTDADTHIRELTARLDASENAHQKNETIMRGDIEALKKAATNDSAITAKQIAALEAENADLQNEAMRSARNRLFWAGVMCLLGGAGAIAAEFGLGFLAGFKIAAFAFPLGAVLITISQLLTKIVFWCEAACIGAVVVLVIVAIWHAFRHEPATGAK